MLRLGRVLCLLAALAVFFAPRARAQDAQPVVPPGYESAPAEPVPAPPPPAPGTSVTTPAASPAPAETTPAPQPPAPIAPPIPVDPDRRRDAELVELVATAFTVGAWGTVSLLIATEADDPLLYLSLPLLGGSLLAGGAVFLDGGDGMRAGVPSAIATGAYFGGGASLLLWGAYQVLSRDEVLALLSVGPAAGLVLGAVVGYALRPTVAENRFWITTALFGGFFALMTGVALDVESKTAWRIATAGFGLGAAIGVLTSALGDLTMRQVGLLHGMYWAGAIVGLMVAGMVHAGWSKEPEADRPGAEVTATGLAIGTGVGLGLGLLLLGVDEQEHGDPLAPARRHAALPVSIGIAPIEGGGMMSAVLTL